MIWLHRPASKAVGFHAPYLVGALGIEPSQPNGSSFTDCPASLAEYAPEFILYAI